MNGYNFTERVRNVLAMAREEAARLHHEYVGTEHILLGLIREGAGVAAAVLQNLNVDLDTLRQLIERTVTQGKASQGTGPDLPYTSRAKKVLELAMDEARNLNHSYVGTEHLLLGLLREEKGIAAQTLVHSGVTIGPARAEILRMLGTEVRPTPPVLHTPEAPRAGSRMGVTGQSMNGYSFSERVRKVLAMSREQAHRLNHEYVGTEHMLLGLIAEGEGVAAATLQNLDVDLDEMRKNLEEIAKQGPASETSGPDLPYTSRAKRVLELSMATARDLNHSYVGTEHLLLGLIREEKGIAAQLLTRAGATESAVRAETLRLLGPPREQTPDEPREDGITGVLIEVRMANGSTARAMFPTIARAMTFLKETAHKSAREHDTDA